MGIAQPITPIARRSHVGWIKARSAGSTIDYRRQGITGNALRIPGFGVVKIDEQRPVAVPRKPSRYDAPERILRDPLNDGPKHTENRYGDSAPQRPEKNQVSLFHPSLPYQLPISGPYQQPTPVYRPGPANESAGSKNHQK